MHHSLTSSILPGINGGEIIDGAWISESESLTRAGGIDGSKAVAYWVCIIMILLTACGSFSLPESCGAGGTADETIYAQHFTWMEIVNEATDSHGEPD